MKGWHAKSGLLLGTAVAAVGGYLAAAQVSPDRPGVTADVQSVLRQGATRHTEPTVWGEFLIVPRMEPSDEVQPYESPRPLFGPDATVAGPFAGPLASEEAEAVVPAFVGVPSSFDESARARGFEIAEASAERDSAGNFRSSLLYLKRDGRPGMILISGYTPTRLVEVTEFPDTAIYEFRATNDVNGHPTITRLPDRLTSDPNGDREVMWSQGGKVYFIKVLGEFSDEEVLSLAASISSSEGGQS